MKVLSRRVTRAGDRKVEIGIHFSCGTSVANAAFGDQVGHEDLAGPGRGTDHARTKRPADKKGTNQTNG